MSISRINQFCNTIANATDHDTLRAVKAMLDNERDTLTSVMYHGINGDLRIRNDQLLKAGK